MPSTQNSALNINILKKYNKQQYKTLSLGFLPYHRRGVLTTAFWAEEGKFCLFKKCYSSLLFLCYMLT